MLQNTLTEKLREDWLMTRKKIRAVMAVILLIAIKRIEIDHAEIEYSSLLKIILPMHVDSKCNSYKETDP